MLLTNNSTTSAALSKLYYPLTNTNTHTTHNHNPVKNNELQRPLHSGNILHYYYNNIGNNNNNNNIINNNELLAKQSNININNMFAASQKAALHKTGFGSRVRPLWVKARPRRSDSQKRPLLLGDTPHYRVVPAPSSGVYSISQNVERWTPRKLRVYKS